MKNNTKARSILSLAIGGSLLSAVSAVGVDTASASVNLDFQALGSGQTVRSQILGMTDSPNLVLAEKEGEAKCGESKCGENKCGDEKQDEAAADHPTTATDASTDQAKSGSEMKCGEGKCG